MTQDQRYDMITEMYEATRYAKEIHKKAKGSFNKMDATPASDKTKDATRKNWWDYFAQDSIDTGKQASYFKKNNMPDEFKNTVNDSRIYETSKHPGRYEKYEERKPGTYLDAQRLKRGK